MGGAATKPVRYDYSNSLDIEEFDYRNENDSEQENSSDSHDNIEINKNEEEFSKGRPVRPNLLSVPSIKRHPFTEYRFTKKLGEGSTSFVFKGLPVHRNRPKVAIKEINTTKLSQLQLRDVTFEMNILSQLRHSSIVRLYAVYVIPEKTFLIMEYLKGGELLQTICKRKNYTENDARRIMTQINSAIQYLHSRKVIHRDLKPENLILVDKDFYSDIKIVDFGYAYVLSEHSSSDAQNNYSCGTPGYMSPEILLSQKYSTAGDIWSLGVILYIIISGTMPFNYRQKDVIITGKFSFPSPFWDNVSPEAKKLISSMLNVNHKARITADEIAAHPWFLINPIIKDENLSSINIKQETIISNPSSVKEDSNKSLIPIDSVHSSHSVQSNQSVSSGDLTNNIVEMKKLVAVTKLNSISTAIFGVKKIKNSSRIESEDKDKTIEFNKENVSSKQEQSVEVVEEKIIRENNIEKIISEISSIENSSNTLQNQAIDHNKLIRLNTTCSNSGNNSEK